MKKMCEELEDCKNISGCDLDRDFSFHLTFSTTGRQVRRDDTVM